MKYTLLKGTFKPSNPDGDSVHFMPDDPEPLRRLPRRNRHRYPDKKVGETVKLRYEGIDTLETDYRGKNQGQFAHKATNKNLEILKVPNQNDEAQGYILTHLIGPYARPITFAFVGDAEENDGTSVELGVDRMRKSVNFKIIQSGLAYPCFYSTLADDLRRVITAAVIEARRNKLGFWPHDHTESGVEWQGPDSVSNLQPIFPKLWRRLVSFVRYSNNNVEALDAFIDYLKFQIEVVYIVSQSRFTTVDQIVTVNENTIKINHAPEDLVFT